MNIFKKYLIPSITIVVYLLLLGTVFFWTSSIVNIGTTIWLQIILFIFLPFSLIPCNKKEIKNIGLVVLGVGLIASIVAYIFLNNHNTIFLVLSHATIVYYLYSRYYYKALARKRYRWTTTSRGIGSVAIMLAITYTSTIWIAWAAAQINCDDIQNQSMGFIASFAPHTQSWSTLLLITQKIDQRWSQSVGQLLWLQNTTLATWDTNNISNDTEHWAEGLLRSIVWYQDKLITSLMENQHLINDQVCKVTLEQIKNVSEHNDVQIVTFILLVLLLYVPMRTIGFVISLINYALINILFWTGRFQIKKETGIIEEINL